LKLSVLCRYILFANVLDLISEYCQFIPQCPRSFLKKYLLCLCSFPVWLLSFQWNHFSLHDDLPPASSPHLFVDYLFHSIPFRFDFVFRVSIPPSVDFGCSFHLGISLVIIICLDVRWRRDIWKKFVLLDPVFGTKGFKWLFAYIIVSYLSLF